MGRILSIDYGQKRVGIAVTDPLKIIANGLTTVSTGEIFKFLTDYTDKEAVELFVVGLPKKMNNEASDSMRLIEPFVRGLRNKFPSIPVQMVDERFTSVLAHQTLLDGGAKKKTRRNKELIDEISATIILQSYLESSNMNSTNARMHECTK
jgi:putative Holliday junction resolvase